MITQRVFEQKKGRKSDGFVVHTYVNGICWYESWTAGRKSDAAGVAKEDRRAVIQRMADMEGVPCQP